MTNPISEHEAWKAWQAEAARLGLHRGERLDFDSLLVGVPPSPAGLDRVIVERTRLARLQRPLYRLEGTTIRLDPLGRVDNMAAIRAELHERAVEAHRAAILADVSRQLAEGRPLAAAARSWNRHPKTLQRWDKARLTCWRVIGTPNECG